MGVFMVARKSGTTGSATLFRYDQAGILPCSIGYIRLKLVCAYMNLAVIQDGEGAQCQGQHDLQAGAEPLRRHEL
jgi:hypothetical protein